MPVFHKQNLSAQVDSLQTTVLSAFVRVGSHSDTSDHVAKRQKLQHTTAQYHKPTPADNPCEDLCCMSTDNGASCLSRLKESLKKRSYTSAQLATHLFIYDEVDTGPPLCTVVQLLQSHFIHLKDIRPATIIARAIFELRNPATCSCRGQRNGVQAMIRFILQDRHSSERDAITEHFLSVLFHGKENECPVPHKKERFRLAEHTLSALREREHQHDEDMPKLCEWARRASLPTKATLEDRGKSDSDIVRYEYVELLLSPSTIRFTDPNQPAINTHDLKQWTSELSGLATGRSPWEYLTYGKEEERALVTLFKVVPALTASRVYLECVHSVFHHATTSPRIPPRAVGCWSRVVILGRRVLDPTSFTDADLELRPGIQSSLNGTLASALSLNEFHDVAVVLCLIRCILVPGGSTEDCSSSSKDLKGYEMWLKDFIARSSGSSSLLTVLKVMTELIPLEPLQLLRVNHKVLLLKREYVKVAGDYLISLRARISDLNPVRSERLLSSKDEDVAGSDPSRIDEEAIRFVLDYSNCRKIPSALVRKMNFHRYYFRTKILKSLLDARLGERFDEKPFHRQLMSASSFDECRIDMIKELAFDRKDKAVTAAEANEAITAIVAANDRKGTATVPEVHNENAGKPAVTESSSVQEICRALFEECHARLSSCPTTSITASGDVLTSVNVLLKRTEERWKSRKDPIKGPELAADVLHGITSALEEAGKSVHPGIFGSLFGTTADAALGAYSVWWKSHGVGLLQAIRHLLERPMGREMQKYLQYQVLALLCAREGEMSNDSAIALAMLATALANAGESAALMDVVMLPKSSSTGSFKDFLSTVITCLPLTRADTVATSVMIALHGVCLCVTLHDFLPPSCQKRQSDESGSDFIVSRKSSFEKSPAYRSMLDLLRWVCCHPWRLTSVSTQEMFPPQGKIPENAVNTLAFISRLLVSRKIPIRHDFSIERYFHTEERCGWGRMGSVYEELRKRESAGAHPTRLLHQFALFLAKRTSRRWPSVDWMEQGMMRYAEDTICCGGFEAADRLTSCDAPQFLERVINSDGDGVGYRLLDLFSRMQCCYFHGYTGADMERHIATTLVPWYWPFSPHHADYLWDCLNKCCSSWESDNSGIKDNFLIVSNFALYGSLRRYHVRDGDGHRHNGFATGAFSGDIVSKRRELRKAMEEMSAFDCGMNSNVGTQVLTRSISRTMLSTTLARAFGSCIVLGLARKCRLLRGNSRAARIRMCVDQIGTVVDKESLDDFLGTAVCVASFLPFTRLAEEYERCEKLTETTDDILRLLVQGHVRQLGEGRGPFNWTRMLLPDRVAGCDDIRTNVVMWMGEHASDERSESKCRLECLPVDVCMARVYKSVGSLCDEDLYDVISHIERDGVSKCLVPNILKTCRRLGSYVCDNADLKMSKMRFDALVEQREVLARELITVVIRILTLARDTLAGFGDDAISMVVARFKEFEGQVISGVTANASRRRLDGD